MAQTLSTDGGGDVHLSDLPPILGDEKVAPELTKGLTTTFLFRVEALNGRAGRGTGGARVEVRYELWDEVFHILILATDGRPRREQVDSMEALHSWWGALRLPVLSADGSGSAVGRRMRVSLDVVPFSRAEESDTQRWFAESVRRAEVGTADSSAGIGESESLDDAGVFELLIATSIRRRPLISYDWTLDMPIAGSP